MASTKKEDCAKIERRRFQRVDDTIFFLYQLKSIGEEIEGIAENIGGGGLMFKTDRFLFTATTIEIEIYEPIDYKKQLIVSIPALAEVVWVNKIKESNRYQGSNRYNVGLKFARIKKEDQDKVVRYVKEKFQKWGF